MGNFSQYLQAILLHWWAIFGGIILTILPFLQSYIENFFKIKIHLKWLWVIAGICFLIANYLAWRDEHLKLEKIRSSVPFIRETQYGNNNSPTQTPDANYETYELTKLACNTVFTVPTGSWRNDQKLIINIFSTGTYTLDFITAGVYAPIGVVLPTITVPNKLLSVGMFYNASRSRWEVKGVSQEQ